MTGSRRLNKAACKRLAAQVREELGLTPMDALDPWDLAREYGIDVVQLSDLPVGDQVRDHFTVHRTDVFSGALVPLGTGVLIVENDAHPLVRRRSTMGHELAHVLGEHTFSAGFVNERGCRIADDVQEGEAAEIGAELLVPFEAAKLLARRGATNQEVALQFGVSVELARWRMDSTGARLMAKRRAATTRGRASSG